MTSCLAIRITRLLVGKFSVGAIHESPTIYCGAEVGRFVNRPYIQGQAAFFVPTHCEGLR